MGYATNDPNDYFALGIQSAKDTEASTFAFFKHGSGTALESDEDVTSVREGGDGQEVSLRYKSMIKLDGGFNGLGRPELSLYALVGVLGRTATTTDADGTAIPSTCNRHRIVPAATLPYFTAEQRYSADIERGTNMKVTQVDIEGEAGKAITLSAQLLNGGTYYGRDTASTLTPARESGDPIYFPRGSYAIDGTGSTKVTKFKVSIKRGIDDGIQTTDLWREDLIELNADYDLDFTLKYEDRTLYQKIKRGSGSMVPINLATGSFMAHMTNGVAAGATTHRSITLNLPLITYVGAKVNKLDPDGKTVYIDVAAMTTKSATHPIVADVVIATRAALA